MKIAWADFIRHNCMYMAAGISYFAILSLFPLILAGVAILGFLYSSPKDQGYLVTQIVRFIPVSTDYLGSIIGDIIQARGSIGLIAFVALVPAGLSVFSAIRKGLNHVWQVSKPQHFLRDRAIDLLMLFGAAIYILLLVPLTTSVPRVPLEILAFSSNFTILLVVHFFVPNIKLMLKDVVAGAVVSALLFQIIRIAFAWFVTNFSSVDLVYGSLSALIVFLIWVYLSSIALMFGAQIASSYYALYGSGSYVDQKVGTRQLGMFDRKTK